MDSETRRLDARIVSFIRRYAGRPAPEKEFNALALEIFAYQFRRNRPYRLWCESEGWVPATVKHWKGIPAVPAEAFKRLRLACFPKEKEVRAFRTSGTSHRTPSGRTGSGGTGSGGDTLGLSRGAHHFDTLKIYEASIAPPFRRHLLSDGADLNYFFLMPSPAEVRDSSLSYMMGVVHRRFARGQGRFYVRRGRPDYARLHRDLSREGGKAFLLSTAFALKGFLEHLEERGAPLRLAAGSRIMETGGFKGRAAEISKKELHRLCGRWLGVPSFRIVSEYGMTELSSQCYDGRAPAWLRSVVVDPATGREARKGAAGLLRHVDLANRGSVIAVETEDLGRLRGGRVELLGRVQDALPRGCSLAFEEFLKK